MPEEVQKVSLSQPSCFAWSDPRMGTLRLVWLKEFGDQGLSVQMRLCILKFLEMMVAGIAGCRAKQHQVHSLEFRASVPGPLLLFARPVHHLRPSAGLVACSRATSELPSQSDSFQSGHGVSNGLVIGLQSNV